jgi:hypothetical protein
MKRTGEGQIFGFSVATLITNPARDFLLDPLRGKVEDWRLTLLQQVIEGSSYVLDFKLRAGSLDHVKPISQQVVADFDAAILEHQRKLRNELSQPPNHR